MKNRRAYIGACILPGNNEQQSELFKHLIFVARSSSVRFKIYSITHHLRYIIRATV